jgi:hypothetical protein
MGLAFLTSGGGKGVKGVYNVPSQNLHGMSLFCVNMIWPLELSGHNTDPDRAILINEVGMMYQFSFNCGCDKGI